METTGSSSRSLILTFNEADKQLLLLKNIAKAIQLSIGPARLLSAEKIELEKGWDVLLQSPGCD